jgi:hypothetical protein
MSTIQRFQAHKRKPRVSTVLSARACVGDAISVASKSTVAACSLLWVTLSALYPREQSFGPDGTANITGGCADQWGKIQRIS